MLRTIDELTITDAVIDQMASTKSERLKELMNAAVRHLHAFAREVNLTPDEWIEGLKFLTATGHACTEYRQEFILLSDTLGLSSLVNSLHDRRTIQESTKSSLLGPFYRQDSPTFELGQFNRRQLPGRGDRRVRSRDGFERVAHCPCIHRSLATGRKWLLRPAEARSKRNGTSWPLLQRRGRAAITFVRSNRAAIKFRWTGPSEIWSERRGGTAGGPPTSTFSSVRWDTAK